MAEAIEDPSMPLERNVFFRFFDLPAELRNKIYVHAFYCYPQPLQFEAVTVRGMVCSCLSHHPRLQYS